MNTRNHAGQTALMTTALVGRIRQIDMLKAAGADVAITDAAGRSASTVAAGQGNTTLAKTLDAGQHR